MKYYHYKISCETPESFAMAIKVARENTIECVIELVKTQPFMFPRTEKKFISELKKL